MGLRLPPRPELAGCSRFPRLSNPASDLTANRLKSTLSQCARAPSPGAGSADGSPAVVIDRRHRSAIVVVNSKPCLFRRFRPIITVPIALPLLVSLFMLNMSPPRMQPIRSCANASTVLAGSAVISGPV